MNVKISNQNLLFKISEAERISLSAGETIEASINFGSSVLLCSVSPQKDNMPCAVGMCLDHSEAYIYLNIPMMDIQRLSDMGKNREGLAYEIGQIRAVLQVDVRSVSRDKD